MKVVSQNEQDVEKALYDHLDLSLALEFIYIQKDLNFTIDLTCNSGQLGYSLDVFLILAGWQLKSFKSHKTKGQNFLQEGNSR